MLTRRGFAGFASCALCGITEFIATEASAQGAQPAATGGVTRKILSQMDGPAPGYETLLVEATIEQGVTVARHKHPGIESAYFLEGSLELPIQGQQTRTVKAGDSFKYRRKHPMRVVSLPTPRPECLSPTLSEGKAPGISSLRALLRRLHSAANTSAVPLIPAVNSAEVDCLECLTSQLNVCKSSAAH